MFHPIRGQKKSCELPKVGRSLMGMNTAAQSTGDLRAALAFELSDRLAKSMHVAGLRNADLAAALDVSATTIGNYTSGRTRPSRLQLREWAVRTGAPLVWLETGHFPEDTKKAPTPKGEGRSLPELDSNQQPAGSWIIPIRKPRIHATPAAA